ncbi:unnamed protein product, partial [Didymodactylos carnosus]
MKLSSNIDKIHDGVGQTLFMIFYGIVVPVGCGILAFLTNWKLTLITIPFMILASLIFSKLIAQTTMNQLQAYAKSGAVAQEIFSSIRTVFAYNASNYEEQRYGKHLDSAKQQHIRKGIILGCFWGVYYMLVCVTYAIGLFAGFRLIQNDNEKNTDKLIGHIVIVLTAIVESIYFLGSLSHNFELLTAARGAATEIWHIFDEESFNKLPQTISTGNEKNIDITGDITFDNVHFSYPARNEMKVLNGLNLTVRQGETVALFGSSGCGKSTCIHLLLRLYEPLSGVIRINGRPIQEYDVKWLRQQIGVVTQEPVLFDTSIYENIFYGSNNKSKVSMSELQEAAKQANAHDFIINLPN